MDIHHLPMKMAIVSASADDEVGGNADESSWGTMEEFVYEDITITVVPKCLFRLVTEVLYSKAGICKRRRFLVILVFPIHIMP